MPRLSSLAAVQASIVGGRIQLAALASLVLCASFSIFVLVATGVGDLKTEFFLGMGGVVFAAGFGMGVAAPAMSALGGSAVQGRLMGLHSGLEVGGRMAGQIVVALLYEQSAVTACVFPVATSLVGSACCGVVLALEACARASERRGLV